MSLANYLSLPRLLSALMLSACGEFCVFGFLASFEVAPGDRTPWLIGYGLLALFFFGNAIRLGLTAFGTRRVIQRQGIVGLIIGSLIAFTPILLLCLLGPRREHFDLLSGVWVSAYWPHPLEALLVALSALASGYGLAGAPLNRIESWPCQT